MTLPPQDAREFFQIMMPLINWVRHLKGARAALRDARKNQPSLFSQEHTLLRVIWSRPELIDRFLVQKGRGADLPDEAKEILSQWREFFLYGVYYIERHTEDGTIFISATSGKTYLVSGMMSDLADSLRQKDLPCAVETALLPFKGRVVYDGAMEAAPKVFGTEGVAALKKVYEDARRKGRIIQSLPSDVPPPDRKVWNACVEALAPALQNKASGDAAMKSGTKLDDFVKQLEANPDIPLITKEQAATLGRLLGQFRRSEADWDVIKDILMQIYVATAVPVRTGRRIRGVENILCEDGDLLVFTTVEKCSAYMERLARKNSKYQMCKMTLLPCEEAFEIAGRHKMNLVIDPPEFSEDGPAVFPRMFMRFNGRTDQLTASMLIKG